MIWTRGGRPALPRHSQTDHRAGIGLNSQKLPPAIGQDGAEAGAFRFAGKLPLELHKTIVVDFVSAGVPEWSGRVRRVPQIALAIGFHQTHRGNFSLDLARIDIDIPAGQRVMVNAVKIRVRAALRGAQHDAVPRGSRVGLMEADAVA